MLNQETKRRIDALRDVLVGKVPDPKAQVEQITIALIYKFMNDMDELSIEFGGEATFFKDDYKKYSWSNIMSPSNSGIERVHLYMEGIEKMNVNPGIPQLFRDIFRGAFLPYRDPETLHLFLKGINDFNYEHSEDLGDAYEYLLSVLGSQGDAGQFRTPRHIIDMIVEIVSPTKNQTILDPACGTAGFLISAYKHILDTNKKDVPGDLLTPDDKKNVVKNLCGYDISPDMVRLSRVNMYLHGFPDPKIYEYDTLTSQDRWNDSYDVILANPPFMTPKGGIKPHNKFSVQANRSEVLFVDYIAEHLNPNGKAGIIVPEGIVFTAANAYKSLRKFLIENNYLYAVISLPAGVFQPYSSVKTSILLMDRALAKKTKDILFVKIENDGFDLGAQRREIEGSDIPKVVGLINRYKLDLQDGNEFKLAEDERLFSSIVDKTKIAKDGDYNLLADRYREAIEINNKKANLIPIEEICDFTSGLWKGEKQPLEHVKILRNTNFTKDGRLDFSDIAEHDVETKQLTNRILEFGDILLEKSGGGPSQPVGRVALFTNTQETFSYSNFTSRIRVKNKDLVNPIYLWRILNYYYQQGLTEKMQNQTSGIRNLDFSIYKQIKIPLLPITVQQKLVEELENYQRIIDGAKQVIDNYSPEILFNPSWDMVELSKISEIISGFAFKSSDFSSNNTGVKSVKITNIGVKCFVENDEGYLPENYRIEYNKYLTNENDIVIALTRPYISGGLKVCIVPNNYANALANQRTAIIRALNNVSDYRYIYYVLLSDFVLDYVIDKSKSLNQPNLSVKDLGKLMIPLPPLSIQQDIANTIDRELYLINSNKDVIATFEQKIKNRIESILM